MARRPGSQKKIGELKKKALGMERQGFSVAEISSAVDRSIWTTYRWLRKGRGGQKPPAKALRILDLHRQGYSIPEIIEASGASTAYAYRVLEHHLDKPERTTSEEKVDEFLATGRFPERDPKDAFAWCLLRRVSEITDNDAVDGLELVKAPLEYYKSQMVSRRSRRRQRSARCLTTQFVNLWGAAHRPIGNLGKAVQAIEIARDLYCGCTDCLAEIERQHGWLVYKVWFGSRDTIDLTNSIVHFSRSLHIYQEMLPRYGHSIHKNGLSGALLGRAASSYYAGDLRSALGDSRQSVKSLDPKKSPNLVLPCSHFLAVCLAATGKQEDLDEAALIMAKIRQRMPAQDIPYAKVLWLSGLLEDDGEGHLLDARDIFIEKQYSREVVTITLDLVAYYGDAERQLRAIQALGNPRNEAAWLEGELSGLGEIVSAVKQGALTLEMVRKLRADVGGELMPDLLWRRRTA